MIILHNLLNLSLHLDFASCKHALMIFKCPLITIVSKAAPIRPIRFHQGGGGWQVKYDDIMKCVIKQKSLCELSPVYFTNTTFLLFKKMLLYFYVPFCFIAP